MEMPEEVLDELKQIAQTQQSLTLLNEYEGVPISYETVIRSLAQSAATFGVHKYQAVCLALEGETVLQSKLLSLAIKARVVTVDVAAGTATLTDFTPAAYTVGRRQAIRLRPQPLVEVYLENLSLRGRLLNVSVSGLGIHLPLPSSVAEPDFQMNPDVWIRLQLPTQESPVKLEGRVAHSTFRNGAYTLGVDLVSEADTQRMLENYIAQRQTAVTQELETLYNRFCADQLKERRKS